MPDDTIKITLSRKKAREKYEAFKERSREILGFQELTDKQQKLLKTNVFIGKFLAVGAVFHLILHLYPDTTGIQEIFAGLLTSTMNAIGYEFTQSGIYIMDGASGYRIVQDCLGWKSMMAFTGLIVASGNVRKNLRFLFGGLVLIAFANYIRVVTTIHLSEIGLITFEVIHSFLWTWSLTGIVLVIWFIWFTRYRK